MITITCRLTCCDRIVYRLLGQGLGMSALRSTASHARGPLPKREKPSGPQIGASTLASSREPEAVLMRDSSRGRADENY